MVVPYVLSLTLSSCPTSPHRKSQSSSMFPDSTCRSYCFYKCIQSYSSLHSMGQENDVAPNPKPSLSFIEDEGGVFIRHSCNGLLLCSSFRCLEADRMYYVCKPTISNIIDFPNSGAKMCLALVFYAIRANWPNTELFLYVILNFSVSHRQNKMYHSDDGLWRVSRNPFFALDDILFSRGNASLLPYACYSPTLGRERRVDPGRCFTFQASLFHITLWTRHSWTLVMFHIV